MKYIALLVSCLSFLSLTGQVTISGRVTDEDSTGLSLVNVYIDKIFEGAITNDSGYFSFSSDTTGAVKIIASIMGYQKQVIELVLGTEDHVINIVLEKDAASLIPVTVSAGTFEASDKKRAVLLKPVDMVTTAGSAGDVYGALQTLPGVVPSFSETGLFVRGGEAYETKTVIDGMVVNQPFLGDVPDIPARGRFSPFQFKGTVFSTGGYSAEYSQALSSVLLLTSQDVPGENSININLFASGINAARVKKIGENKALIAEVNYTDLSLLFGMVPQNPDWLMPPRSHAATLNYRAAGKKRSMFRSYARYQFNEMELMVPDINEQGTLKPLGTKNANIMFTNTYSSDLGKRWSMYAGLAYTYDNKRRSFSGDRTNANEHVIQARTVLMKRFVNPSILLKSGAELNVLRSEFFENTSDKIKETYAAAFSEAEVQVSRKLAYRAGVRLEVSETLNEARLSPRLSLAYKTSAHGQVSVAYGVFCQSPENPLLRDSFFLDFQQAAHYIVNYQFLSNKHTFRIEAYCKKYTHLIRNFPHNEYSNSGYGYATGIDLFWRDMSIKNFEYWITWSWLRSKRLFRSYLYPVVPSFAPEHTGNLVLKYELPKIRSRVGATYTFSSARSYVFTGNSSMLFSKTPTYHNLSFNFSYLTSVFKNFTVMFISVNNALGIKNVLGYRYSVDGAVRNDILPSAYRSFFAGMFISILK